MKRLVQSHWEPDWNPGLLALASVLTTLLKEVWPQPHCLLGWGIGGEGCQVCLWAAKAPGSRWLLHASLLCRDFLLGSLYPGERSV